MTEKRRPGWFLEYCRLCWQRDAATWLNVEPFWNGATANPTVNETFYVIKHQGEQALEMLAMTELASQRNAERRER